MRSLQQTGGRTIMHIDFAQASLPQWGSFIGIISGLIGLAIVYIKGIPSRIRANSEAKQADNADYSAQIKDFRDEVHGYRNDLHLLQARLAESETASRFKAVQITNMTFIIRLLITELQRLDPQSFIVKQAETLLKQMDMLEVLPTTAAESAQDTVRAAQATVNELARQHDMK